MHQARALSRCSLLLVVTITLLQGISHAAGPFNTKVWSPDGRYIAFVASGKPLVVHDTQNGSNKIFEKILYQGSIDVIPQFVSNTKAVIPSNSAPGTYIFDVVSGDIQELSIEIEHQLFCVSSDGKYMYAVTKPDHDILDQRYIVKALIDNTKEQERLAESPNSLLFDQLSLSPDDTRLMFLKQYDMGNSLGKKILILDLTTQETTEILDNNNYSSRLDSVFWVDDQRIAYVDVHSESWYDDVCTLYVHDLKTGQRCKWADHLRLFQQPTVSPDGKSVWFRYLTMPEKEEHFLMVPGSPVALGRINTDTGEMQTLPEPLFPIRDAYASPDGQQLVYWKNDFYTMGLLFLYDLTTQKEEIIWTSKDVEPIKEAHALQQQGDTDGAIRIYKQLIDSMEGKYDSYTKGNRSACIDILMNLYLQMEPPQLKNVFELKHMNEQHEDLWRPEDVIATDPVEDNMVWYHDRYMYPQNDMGRDVFKLSMRISEERLYFHLKNPSTGHWAKYRSIVLLFDYDSPDEGQNTIFPNTRWERGAERILYFHEEQNFLITDAEKILAQGAVNHPDSALFVVASYSSNGVPAFYDHHRLPVPEFYNSGVIFSVSRDILGLMEEQKVQLQVCTIKRFPEGRKENKYERPLVYEEDGKPMFNIADAFGETNTEERVNAEIAAGKLPVAEGFAAEFVLPAYTMTKDHPAGTELLAHEKKDKYLAEILLPAHQREKNEKDAKFAILVRALIYVSPLLLLLLCIVGVYCIKRFTRQGTRMDANSV